MSPRVLVSVPAKYEPVITFAPEGGRVFHDSKAAAKLREDALVAEVRRALNAWYYGEA